MNAPRAMSFISGTGLLDAGSSPKLRWCALGIALMLPGSFLVLPLLWVWRRRRSLLAPRAAPSRSS